MLPWHITYVNDLQSSKASVTPAVQEGLLPNCRGKCGGHQSGRDTSCIYRGHRTGHVNFPGPEPFAREASVDCHGQIGLGFAMQHGRIDNAQGAEVEVGMSGHSTAVTQNLAEQTRMCFLDLSGHLTLTECPELPLL